MRKVLTMEHSLSTATLLAKQKRDSAFLKRGVVTATLSGITYGLYTAFLNLGMTQGIWAEWYGPETLLAAFTITFLVATLGSAINDTCSAIWCLFFAARKGKLGDFFKSIPTKPGIIMICAALVGGPISSAAYIVAIQMAGSIVIPISALCPAIGAILGRVLFKQELNKRMMLGILICLVASALIGSSALDETAPDGLLLGILIAFIAAFGWGAEGCIAGYGTSMIDYEIGITIRQITSGLGNLFILLPIMALIGGFNAAYPLELAGQAITSTHAMIYFVISGFFAVFAYSLWYKGNSMCGAALGMACNGAFSFWGPFFCWLVIGVFAGVDGWSLPLIAWIAAILMAFGIWVIAMNPLDLFKKDPNKELMRQNKNRTLNYDILKYFTTVDEASADDVMDALRIKFSNYKTFTKENVIEALMTAECNALISEKRAEIVDGDLVVIYGADEEQRKTINAYIK